MIKNFLYITLSVVILLLASCGNGKSTPKAIEGYEFTGNGFLGNLPYTMASIDYQRSEKQTELKEQSGYYAQNEKYVKELLEEYGSTFEELAKGLDGKEIPFERHVDGKKEELKGFKLKLTAPELLKYAKFCFDIEKPEDYSMGKSGHGSVNKILPVDKDGKALDLDGVRWLKYGIAVAKYPFRLDSETDKKNMLQGWLYMDRVAKLVEVDDEALTEYSEGMED